MAGEWVEVWQPANPDLFLDGAWMLGQVQGDKVAVIEGKGFFMRGGWIPVTDLQTTKWRRVAPPKTNEE
jgi:hypothetical protein